jgi:serine/threonine protein kinase
MRGSGSRITDARERRSTASSEGSRQLLTRISSALASPLSVMLVVPFLVLVVGLVLILLGDRALRGSNLDVARARLGDQAQTVARMVRLALSQADPLLDRLAGMASSHSPEQPFEAFAHSLANLMQGRAGVAYISVSFPDGTFQGAYLDAHGTPAFQDSRLIALPEGARVPDDQTTLVRRYAFGPPGALTKLGDERTGYDPRKRGFYQMAVRAGGRIWTEPYPFFVSRVTGITRARPVYREQAGKRVLHAVITVDFDVQELSSFLQARSLPGMRAVLYSSDGSVLARAASDQTPPAIPKEERTLRFADLGDPVLHAFHASPQAHSAGAMDRLVVAGEPFLSVTARASADPSLQWWVAYLAPERAFLGALYRYQSQSLWTAGAVLLVAFGVAWLFGLHVTRARREIAAAKAEAIRARTAARELGSYRLVNCLGRGGMGEVWRAEHRLLTREAAIKLIKPQDSEAQDMDELKARFRREAEALSALRSRHTIELFDYGVADDGTFFFVMELLDGMDLETLVQRHGAQPVARVLPLLIQACSSLAEAHDVGLVHRDIKPPNIFICRAADELDVVKVLDFGLVRGVARGEDLGVPVDLAKGTGLNAGQLTSSGGALGTPGYMAPEQALGHELDGRADLYALGCVAVWLLTGRQVFDYDNPYQRLIATLTEDVPDFAARIPGGAPDALLAILRACLSRQPDGRPANARELAQLLRAVPLNERESWSEAKARAFWSAHVPERRTPTPSMAPTSEQRRLMVAPESTD